MTTHRYDILVLFTVRAEADDEAEGTLDYALAHATLLNEGNGIEGWSVVGKAASDGA